MVNLQENSDKNVKIFPYKCEIDSGEKVSKFPEIFKIENADNNVIEYISNTYLVLVIDEVLDGFMFGRFFKLRDDSPTIFNRKECMERPVDLLSEENIKEESHFIWNIKDNILFAEYNFVAIRMFSSPFSYYLNEKFSVDDCKIKPIEDKNTFNNLKKEDEILSLSLRVTQESTKTLEEKYNLPAWRGLLDISQDNETLFDVVIKRGRRKDNKLDKDKVISFAENLVNNKAPIESIKVETQDIVYDLIKNNLLFYYADIKKDGRNLDKSDFNYKISTLYKKHIDAIKSNLKID